MVNIILALILFHPLSQLCNLFLEPGIIQFRNPFVFWSKSLLCGRRSNRCGH